MIVRAATADDAEVLAVVQVRTSREAYRGTMPQEYLDQLDVSRRREVWRQLLESDRPPAGTLVAECPGHGVVGFINVAASGDAELVGEVRAVYVLPEQDRKSAAEG